MLADVVMLIHAAFVAFVLVGGLLVLRWPRLVGPHLAAVAWGVLLELAGLACPLTPLENRLREHAGDAPYGGGFVDRYVLPWLYPEGLTRDAQVALGLGALVLNAAVYRYVWHRRAASRLARTS